MHTENPRLVSLILKTNQPTFISIRPTEVDKVKIEKKINRIFLSCISEYPTLLSDVIIPDFKNSIFTGISDHSLGLAASLKACAHGGQYLEKHFTIDKNLQKVTEKAHLGSMDYNDLVLLKNLTDELDQLGLKPKKI